MDSKGRLPRIPETETAKFLSDIGPDNRIPAKSATNDLGLLAAVGASEEPRNCGRCGGPIEGSEWQGKIVFIGLYCFDCVDALDREAKAAQAAKDEANRTDSLRKFWHGVWGEKSIYHTTDAKRFPKPAAWAEVRKWEPGKSMFIYGDSGDGKTRMIYLRLKQVLWETGHRASIWNGVDLKNAIADAARSDDNRREKLMRRLCETPTLVIDDLPYMVRTDAGQEYAYEIVKTRTDQGLAMLITSQHSPDELAKKFRDGPQGEAVARRLMEFCQLVPC